MSRPRRWEVSMQSVMWKLFISNLNLRLFLQLYSVMFQAVERERKKQNMTLVLFASRQLSKFSPPTHSVCNGSLLMKDSWHFKVKWWPCCSINTYFGLKWKSCNFQRVCIQWWRWGLGALFKITTTTLLRNRIASLWRPAKLKYLFPLATQGESLLTRCSCITWSRECALTYGKS